MAGPSRPTLSAASFRVSCGPLLLACRVLQGNTRLQNKHRATLAARWKCPFCSIRSRPHAPRPRALAVLRGRVGFELCVFLGVACECRHGTTGLCHAAARGPAVLRHARPVPTIPSACFAASASCFRTPDLRRPTPGRMEPAYHLAVR